MRNLAPSPAVRAAAACAALFGAVVLAAPHGAHAASCWKRVIADWSDNGRIDGMYPATCYRGAIANLPEDLLTYSSAPDDIQRALLESAPARDGARVAATPIARAAPVSEPGDDGGLAVIIVAVGAGTSAAAISGYIVWRRPQRQES